MKQTLNLYKYRPLDEWTIKELKERTIHFKCPNEYNDPFDCRINLIIDGTDEQWESYRQRMGITTDELKAYKAERKIKVENSGSYYKEIHRHSLLNIRLSCFSEVPDNILMWSHYADSHKGICLMFETIEFDTIQYLDLNKEDLQYNSSKLPPDHSGIIRVRYAEKLPESYNHLEYDKDKIAPFLMTKSTDWAYEKEWRMMLPKEALKTDNPRYLDNQLKGIIFGLNCSDENKNNIKDIFKGQAVSFYQATAIKNEYKLEICP
ncbi:MAG: DUF2971 domain-containing protein [Bacteroidia bacterium]|jgi:hypothetical protein